MIPILSLVTSVKDYLEVVHKLIEYDSMNLNYNEFGTVFTYFLISVKTFLADFVSFSWLKNIWSLPVIMPEISAAMLSEISVLDGYFHNAFNFLETPISYGEQNGLLYGLEKFTIGVLNSLFLFLPTSTAHIITLRRFVMQGLEAGYVSGLGTIAGNVLWLTSVIFGWRFFVIPWLSLDIFRYLLGFVLLIKYMWDSYNEQKQGSSNNATLDTTTKQKMFLLNFLLVLTEQTSIYPFISNLSISPETSILESFPVDSYSQFIFVHGAYLLGITLGCFSLLHFTCWFWENPAFKIYMWVISSFKVSTSVYYKALNFAFLYLTMISAISSIPYYGLDYTITNPLGYVNDDRIIQDKLVLETSFLGGKASDRNTRRNRGRHGRRERWKRRIRKYRTFDASLYDQGIYDLFTIEDLNYGFDRFWLRRKLRNHRVRFRFFPGPWMRTFKKQLAKPRLESYTGPRSEFFRILFEQVYHPAFHAYEAKQKPNSQMSAKNKDSSALGTDSLLKDLNNKNFLNQPFSIYSRFDSKQSLLLNEKYSLSSSSLNNQTANPYKVTENVIQENSTLRKFVRKLDTRLKMASLATNSQSLPTPSAPRSGQPELNTENSNIYSKQWKHLFSKMYHNTLNIENSTKNPNDLSTFNKSIHRTNAMHGLNFLSSKTVNLNESSLLDDQQIKSSIRLTDSNESVKKQNTRRNLSTKDLQILRYRALVSDFNATSPSNDLKENKNNKTSVKTEPQYLLHPLKFYLQREAAFKRKLRYYSPNVFRKFSVENNAPYFRVMMRRYFYNYKPTLRWERTMKVASLRKARRKTTRIPRKLQMTSGNPGINNLSSPGVLASYPEEIGKEGTANFMIASKRLQKPTYNYSVVSKKASRYRYQIYKDVLQHMYYSPFNRLLLKLDVDSFIRRQPKTHFLTQKEENLLHLRRFLISEHYNTLRWYTNMEHYRSMKTRLNGGSKSFSSRAYNQQFAGTFKKIRHLFAITPSQGQDNVILKFDQALYNDGKNTSTNPLLNQIIIHEELLPLNNEPVTNSKNGDILNQSQNIVRTYLTDSREYRDQYIKNLLNEKNYTKLTQFLYKGQKLRGTEPATNQRLLNLQEKEALLTNNEKRDIEKNLKSLKLRKFIMDNNLLEDLYVTYLKNWKRKMNDQEALRNYLTRRVEKREKHKQNKEKHLLNKLKRLEMWIQDSQTNSSKTSGGSMTKVIPQNDILTTGLQKAIFEGMTTLNNVDTNVQKPTEKTLWKVLLLSSIKAKSQATVSSYKDLPVRFSDLNLKKQTNVLNNIKTSTTQLQTLVKVVNQKNPKSNSAKKSLLQIQTTTANVYSRFKKSLTQYLGLETLTNLFKPIKRKSLKNWRQKEQASGRQKRSRKDFKMLNKKSELKNDSTILASDRNDIELALQTSFATGALEGRKKRDVESQVSTTAGDASQIQPTQSRGFSLPFGVGTTEALNLENTSFKRKRSPQRRARVRRSRGVFKKRTLSDSLKKDIKRFVNTKDQLSIEDKTAFFDTMNTNLYSITSSTAKDTEATVPLKQRKSKQRKQRYWKQKRSKYAQKRRKYRKRKRYAVGKIRILSKQLKRVKNKIEIQNWWWKQFVPSIQASTDALWQIEKDKFIQQKLSELSSAEILERDQMFNSSMLQIGNKDFKPLATPEAMRLKEKLTSNQTFAESNVSTSVNKIDNSPQNSSNFDVVNKLYENLFISNSQGSLQLPQNGPFMTPNTMLPFYAGWDESLRKFVVTNRMLSRRDAGFEMNQVNNSTLVPALKPLMDVTAQKENVLMNIEFSQAPVQGMNAATTLYWQIPFTTYDPDQFFALGMDGFSPIGWRKFLFRHSILKTWLNTANDSNSGWGTSSTMRNPVGAPRSETNGSLVIQSKTSLVNTLKDKSMTQLFKRSERTFDAKNATRRLKKRYRRVKKHPRTPVWFPSGPLLNQVLPVHYIYVFYKRSRLPRDRYLKRRLLNTKAINKSEGLKTLRSFEGSPYLGYDFTLRKRLKPKRKYHLKRDFYASNVVIPRRFKFITEPLSGDKNTDILASSATAKMWRPLSSLKINKPIVELVKEQKLLRSKQRRKDPSSKQQTPLLRVKQLRRRVQRQILRSIWRYRPRSGGFVWPGDYLKLELVKAPKLQAPDLQTPQVTEMTAKASISTTAGRGKKKKKRTLVEWQIQPKKYLYEKHNIKVLKKKLEKAFRADSMQQKIQEMNYKL